MLELIYASAEYRDFGWNPATIGAIGITIFTLLETWGLLKQNATIWSKRSAEALSLRWFAYMGSFFVATAPYAVHYGSVSMAFNAIVPGLLHIPILIGLVKFKRLGLNETVQSLAFPLMIPLMLLTEHKEIVYLILSFGTLYSLGTQPWTMLKERSAGVVSMRMIAMYVASGVFWLIYGYSIRAPALMISVPIAVFLLCLTGFLCFWYRGYMTRIGGPGAA